ncbi:glycosyltransferase family 117 protein [Foetidibacter luteolus]|uniref:glycosyltransferase family 117 protein n=1 Tax=Foetidibacter luteolus TaxID=2608880 RepID=UPI001F39FCD5|nr:DUF2723 domain-containing protein [Foetidibacter luteolus]
MQFRTINNIAGWLVCLLACSVYILTAEAGGSLWDCGEFISSCFKLQVPHPPGAPLFVLIGRIFIVFFGDNPLTAAKAVNILSALASGFTILFLFWTITHFARKTVQQQAEQLTKAQVISIIGAGLVGALAYTFSDSFWFSAVEGEVYALSSFFTAIVFWAILKWEYAADRPGADKWIVFIFFLMGLSIGVHLLNLLTIPAIVMVYYFKKRNQFNYRLLRKYFLRITLTCGALASLTALASAGSQANESLGIAMDSTVAGLMLLATLLCAGFLYLVETIGKKQKEIYGGAYIFLVLGCAITGAVQVGVIKYSVKLAGNFDVFFVNQLGLPFFSGFAFFFVLVALAIRLGLKYAERKGMPYLRLGLWCFTFMLVGYSSYITTMLRSNADPALDISNVDNPVSLNAYLGREQYGDFPLLYGQKFTAQPIDYKETSTRYVKGDKNYVDAGKNFEPVYAPEDKMIFPRMWDTNNEQNHADYYANFAGIGRLKDGSYESAPNFADNISYFISYQNYYMYFRYFMWNFSGKQNDLQGMFNGYARDGNWITGIGFIDNLLYGNQKLLPDSIKNNKAHNKLFMLPLILGLIGLLFHFKRRGGDALANLLLFLCTGVAIVLYINQPGFQPRERDYAYVGSFFAFSVWIGLGVLKVKEWFAKLTAPGLASSLAVALCVIAVPLLMAQQGWDDHDRSKKQLARDLAKNYLESCAPNAILFSTADNDTYPLWYAQEVEGIRPDVRIVITSLLTADWYINQLRYKLNNSNAVDVIWSKEQITGSKRDVALYRPLAQYPENRYYDLYDMMKNYIGSDDPANMEQRGIGSYNTFPVKKVAVPVDKELVLKNGTVNDTDVVLPEMRFELTKNILYKHDLAILNIIAANKWQRPVYFTLPNGGSLGFENYLRKDGLTYRLVPVANNTGINTDYMYATVMNKFSYGNADLPGVYFDEENRRHLNIIRRADTELAMNLLDTNHLEEAKKVLKKTDKMILQENLPYGMVSKNNEHNRISLMFLQACYRANEKELAGKVVDSLKRDLEQQLKYYNSMTGEKADLLAYDKSTAVALLDNLNTIQKAYTDKQSILR